VVCAAVSCVGLVTILPDALSLGGCVNATAPATSPVSTDAARVAKLFPRLGPVEKVHWRSSEVRPRSCPDIGPMDYVYEGVVVLRADTTLPYREPCAAAAPEIPQPLRGYAPAGVAWRECPALHDAIAGAADVRSHFFVDAGSRTVYFRTGTE
jgi:hypothetical protein